MNPEEFNSELYEKCVIAGDLLFSNMLSTVVENEKLSAETIEIIKEDNTKRLYNLAIRSFWIYDGNVDNRIREHLSSTDSMNINIFMGFFEVIR